VYDKVKPSLSITTSSSAKDCPKYSGNILPPIVGEKQ
jgi:hypothetical protein